MALVTDPVWPLLRSTSSSRVTGTIQLKRGDQQDELACGYDLRQGEARRVPVRTWSISTLIVLPSILNTLPMLPPEADRSET